MYLAYSIASYILVFFILNLHSTDKTPMAAYVDTGAQVTIISASAAKRAGIYHLMDRRYAGRATGVGHCKVLGRIPARHVYFILGESCNDDEEDYEEEEDDYWSDNDYGGDYRGGGGDEFHQGEDDDESSSNMVQMDGPALTVLEGTVTQGVDVLLGLDVLQDWEAEIRMGPKKKSITVKKRRGSGSSVVIPFASAASSGNRRSRYPEEQRRRNHLPLSNKPRTHHHYDDRRSQSRHHHNHESNSRFEEVDFDDEDDDFSPTASDIESDLDLLDQSSHEFPGGSNNHLKIIHTRDLEDEVLDAMDAVVRDDDDDEEDFLQDMDEGVEATLDGEGEIDMSGL